MASTGQAIVSHMEFDGLGAVDLTKAELLQWLNHIEEIRSLPAERQDPASLAAGLWLGGAGHARRVDALTSLGILAIVNTASGDFTHFGGSKPEYPEQWEYCEVDAVDAVGASLLRRHFHHMLLFLEDCVQRELPTFVHCMMGMNRSATTCVAFLMCHFGWPLPKALHHVTSRRPGAVANLTFQKELIALAKLTGLLVRDAEVDQLVLDAEAPARHVWRLATDEGCSDVASGQRLTTALRGLGSDVDPMSDVEIAMRHMPDSDGMVTWDQFRRFFGPGVEVEHVGRFRADPATVSAILADAQRVGGQVSF
eukprot:gnl/TRDRNA2_/TRDRNA2_120566_c1_seq1.p1 gnl/TRDRNA2_/TRDRNA2_120566_c1~~gnl/TRDRNA2_/TRDRNA2_120566_c1_seq1.p1  ORF type:complete len:310 (-),score=33.49 gnl/TRDRNA2_/TRDRNA2_120566_c1_seq1:291-1220(-)